MESQMKVNGELVRAIREERSWSQEHLASASGVSVRTVQRVESESVASSETRLALAAALGVPVAVLSVVSPQTADKVSRLWNVPHWIWVIWGIASGCSIVFIAFDYFDQTRLSHMALNLIPLLALVGACLGAVALAGGWLRSRPRDTV